MTIPNFLAAISGGDLPADAVREDRCLKAPIGCGQPLIAEDGTARVFWDDEEASRYEAEWRITGLCPDCQDALDADEPITDLATAVEVMGALPMPAGPAAPKPRWQQARTELIRTFRDYMPETAATKATDLLDEVIAELGGRTAGAAEYGIRIPDGDVLLDGDPTDRAEQEARLDRYRGKALWPDAVLVQRPVFHGDWTEAK